MTAVAVEAAVKRFGGHAAVDGVSLRLEAGQRLALLGHNGAGKTTLMKLLLGLLRADGGTVSVLGGAPGRSEARRAVGFLPENVAFHDAMTGWEMITFYARLKRRPRDEAAALLRDVGLEAAAKRRVGTYSKGMRQRLGLAQALLGAPRLLLLDEPTTGLDPELRQAFYEIIRARAAAGCAVILSSHLLTELEERTDRIAIMDRGRVVAHGTLDQLRAAAGLPVVFRLALADGRSERVRAPVADKMATLRRLAADDAVRDIEVEPPSLDAVYAHFTEGDSCAPS